MEGEYEETGVQVGEYRWSGAGEIMKTIAQGDIGIGIVFGEKAEEFSGSYCRHGFI